MLTKKAIPFDDNTNLMVYIWENPEQKAQAVVQIAHGMAEHLMRYDAFAEYLVSKGFIVVGADHYAHGLSVKSREELGVIRDYDFMDAILKGMKLIRDELEDYFTGRKAFLFAHSMGSMAAQRYIEKYPDDFSKVVISGTDIGSFKYQLAKMITNRAIKKNGPIYYSNFIESIGVGAFSKKFKADHPKLGWLSSVPEVVKAYEIDPLCGVQFPANYYNSLTCLMLDAVKKENLSKINSSVKILIIAGEKDPVGSFGSSPKKLNALYKKYNLTSNCILYPGARHECLNEQPTIREKVYKDVCKFFWS